MVITQIRVPAWWAPPHPSGGAPSTRYDVAVFSLGIGPCGKVADALNINIDSDGVCVYQTCGDEKKTFFYPIHTLTGRVEITMKNENNT